MKKLTNTGQKQYCSADVGKDHFPTIDATLVTVSTHEEMLRPALERRALEEKGTFTHVTKTGLPSPQWQLQGLLDGQQQ